MAEDEQRAALITGSTRGIGLAVARQLAADGLRVVVHGRKQSTAQAIAAGIEGAVPIAATLEEPTDADRLVQRTLEQFGRVDVVVNNAGVALDNFVTGVTDERWQESLAINLTAPFAILRAATRAMKDQGTGGSIINMTSTSGERGNVGQAAYAATKAGLHGVTMTAAKELGRFGIRVNSISPMVGTEMNGMVDPEKAAGLALRLPLGTVGTPSDVADVVSWLVSDRARLVTGELIHVDAGFHLI